MPAPVGIVTLFCVAARAHLMTDECTVDSQSPPHSPPVRMLWTHVRSWLPCLPHNPLPCCALPADCAGLPRSQRVDATLFHVRLWDTSDCHRPRHRALRGNYGAASCNVHVHTRADVHGGCRRRPRAGRDPGALPLPLVCNGGAMVEQVRLPDAPVPPLPSPPLPCDSNATRLWCALPWTA